MFSGCLRGIDRDRGSFNLANDPDHSVTLIDPICAHDRDTRIGSFWYRFCYSGVTSCIPGKDLVKKDMSNKREAAKW